MCDLARLDKADFLQCLAMYPDQRERFRQYCDEATSAEYLEHVADIDSGGANTKPASSDLSKKRAAIFQSSTKGGRRDSSVKGGQRDYLPPLPGAVGGDYDKAGGDTAPDWPPEGAPQHALNWRFVRRAVPAAAGSGAK
eukprot:1176030-Prorocentrum_minimum.AAC.6